MNPVVALALMVFLTMPAAPAEARNLPSSKLMGRWCGATSNYVFTRQSLTVEWKSNGARRRFVIVKFITQPDLIDVHWVRDDAPQNTVFAKFSNDGKTMAQLANTHGDLGPERLFRRC